MGTASVRAALVSEKGAIVKKSSAPIKINNPRFCLRFDVSGRKQTSSHFKVKIKIQNDLTDHPSANQIANKHIRIVFHSLKAFFSVLKCQISAVKILKRLMLL